MEIEEIILKYKKMLNDLIHEPKHSYEELNLVPKKGGLYILCDKKEEVIYVGITTTRKTGLNGRLKAHFSGNINSSVFDKAINKSNPNFNNDKQKIKDFIRKNFVYVFKEIENLRDRKLIEDFIVSVINPKFNYYFINGKK